MLFQGPTEQQETTSPKLSTEFETLGGATSKNRLNCEI